MCMQKNSVLLLLRINILKYPAVCSDARWLTYHMIFNSALYPAWLVLITILAGAKVDKQKNLKKKAMRIHQLFSWCFRKTIIPKKFVCCFQISKGHAPSNFAMFYFLNCFLLASRETSWNFWCFPEGQNENLSVRNHRLGDPSGKKLIYAEGLQKTSVLWVNHTKLNGKKENPFVFKELFSHSNWTKITRMWDKRIEAGFSIVYYFLKGQSILFCVHQWSNYLNLVVICITKPNGFNFFFMVIKLCPHLPGRISKAELQSKVTRKPKRKPRIV